MHRANADPYRELFDGAAAPVFVVDPGSDLRDANQAAADLVGVDGPGDLIGTDPAEVFGSDTQDRLDERVRREERWVGELTVVTADDSRVPVPGSVVPLSDRSAVACVLSGPVAGRDRMESLRSLTHALRHNIRTDANVVLGNAERIAARVDDDAVHEQLDLIRDRLGHILDRAETARRSELLARRPAGAVTGTVQLDAIVRDAVASAREDHPAATFDVTVTPVEVVADPAVQGAVEELLENAAVHAGDEPHVEVTVDPDGDEAVLAVADDGDGVRPGRRDAVFGRTVDVNRNDGVGLVYVDQVMRACGGRATVDDAALGGARFSLRFQRPEA